jgi:Sigma-54 interaction domain
VKDSARLDPSALLAFSLRCPPDERRHPHHNMLLEGPEAATGAVLRLLVPRLCEPVVWTRRGEPFARPAGEIGTLILEDASNLDRDGQRQLLQWLDDVNPRPRIVCTTARPLFGLVASGLFDVDLYYRLNVMLLHVDIRHQAGLRPDATASEAVADRLNRSGRRAQRSAGGRR